MDRIPALKLSSCADFALLKKCILRIFGENSWDSSKVDLADCRIKLLVGVTQKFCI
ncbi:hypothetical protein [Pseudophaeobacter arcticus]|uniref:hypothetical protein n=1 Tax=Pseudophaeobacter arcticus TaxID=385492 RepID=UPI0036D43892